ncbi:MAG: DnaD domain protein [Clostridia bacterium]|nr:DnaD domain protein [Clostridia bacterium]
MKVSKKNISLPEKLADYVADMSGEDSGELRVLVYVLSGGDGMDTAEIAERLGMAEQDVVSAVSFWRGMGFVSSGTRASAQRSAQSAKKDESPRIEATAENQGTALPPSVRDTDTRTYSGEEIAEILDKKPELKSLADFAQARLEKIFNRDDYAKLVYLEDYVLMTPPMIMKVIDYCVEMDKKSMRYVEKTALSIYDEGIQTYAALEAYFENKKKAKSNEGTVRRIMGIGERSFTTAEKAHIVKWFGEYGSSEELITLAYDKTIASISKPSVPYMSKLLARWYESGYKTAQDVENGNAQSSGRKNIDISAFDESIPPKKGAGSVGEGDSSGLDLDAFFEN